MSEHVYSDRAWLILFSGVRAWVILFSGALARRTVRTMTIGVAKRLVAKAWVDQLAFRRSLRIGMVLKP